MYFISWFSFWLFDSRKRCSSRFHFGSTPFFFLWRMVTKFENKGHPLSTVHFWTESTYGPLFCFLINSVLWLVFPVLSAQSCNTCDICHSVLRPCYHFSWICFLLHLCHMWRSRTQTRSAREKLFSIKENKKRGKNHWRSIKTNHPGNKAQETSQERFWILFWILQVKVDRPLQWPNI